MTVDDKFTFLTILSEIDEKYIEQALVPWKKSKKDKLTYHLGRKVALGTVAAIVWVIILSITNPVLARKIPFIGNVFEYLQNKLDFSGAYNQYSSDVEVTAKSNGITAKIKEAYCDGENLFVSYQIESEKTFSSYTSENYLKTQLDFAGVVWASSEGKILEVDDFGVSGLEGEFIDDHTFIGVDTVRLADKEFPDELIYEMEIWNWNLILNNGTVHAIKGYWDLSVPVIVNKADVETISLNVTEQQHNIDKIVVSPIMITIYTSYPEIYNDSVNYEVVVFSEKSDGKVSFQGSYGNTEGKTWIPRNMVGDTLDIYVIDFSTFTLEGADAYGQKEIEKHAIVSTHIELGSNQK